MIGSVILFVIGSGISGGAINAAMMIAGRTVQGIGGGGINVLIDMIVSDMVPLRERGNFMGMIFAVFSIGTSLGPFIGGAVVQHSSWRWVVSSEYHPHARRYGAAHDRISSFTSIFPSAGRRLSACSYSFT